MRINHFLLLITILYGCFNISYAQKASTPKNEQQFMNTCKKIAQALINKDLETVNLYVNPSIGVYAIYMPGANPGYLHLSEVVANAMSFSLEAAYRGSTFPKNSTMKFDNHIKFDCSNGWNKKGSFIDVSNKHKPLSEIDLFWEKDAKDNNYESTKNSNADSVGINKIEKKLRKVIFTNVGCCGMVFYMSFINNKWYLTIIDQAETNCDG
jgi:hypothetical protein